MGVAFADRLEDGFVRRPSLRMGSTWGCEAVDDAIHLTKILFDGLDHFGLHLVRECITIEGLRVKASGLGFLFKSSRIVPTCCATASLVTGLLEENTDGGRIGSEGSGDA